MARRGCQRNVAMGIQAREMQSCLFFNPTSNLMTLVHGDDFVSVGSRRAAKEFKKQLESRFEIKSQVIGPGPTSTLTRLVGVGAADQDFESESAEGGVLNRVLRWTRWLGSRTRSQAC